jgi:cobalt-precorrin-5B (C1)-methyltransferase
MMEKTVRRGERTGFTTGACTAAAARAAALGLVTGAVPDTVESLLPNGQRVASPCRTDVRMDSAPTPWWSSSPATTRLHDGAHLTVDLRRLPGRPAW